MVKTIGTSQRVAGIKYTFRLFVLISMLYVVIVIEGNKLDVIQMDEIKF